MTIHRKKRNYESILQKSALYYTPKPKIETAFGDQVYSKEYN